MSELKPCPFCGECDGEENESTIPTIEGGMKRAVYCNCCFAEGPPALTSAEAVARWNLRAVEADEATKGRMNNEPRQGIGESRREPALSDEIRAVLEDMLSFIDADWDVPHDLWDKCRAILARAGITRREPLWIPVADRLPEFAQDCDWLFPRSEAKRERWILCCESQVTASVPGRATHWRPAEPLPPKGGIPHDTAKESGDAS